MHFTSDTRTLVWGLLLLTACGGHPPTGSMRIPVGEGSSGAWAYGDESTHRPHPLGHSVINALAALGIEAELDPSLSHAAHLLAPAMDARQTVSREALVFALGHAGVHYPVDHLSGAELTGATVAEAGRILAAYLQETTSEGQFSHLGVGVDDFTGAGRIMLLLGQPLTALERVARHQALGISFPVVGSVAEGYQRPRLVVTQPSGTVASVETRVSQGGFSAQVQCPGTAGRLQVEVLADGPHGPTVAANFPVWCGAPPTTTAHVPRGLSPRKGASPEASAKLLFDRLNDARRRADLPPLRWNALAAEVGRAHSQEMAETGFVGHFSPWTGGPEDRARAARLHGAIIRENVGVAGNEDWIHSGLMASPGHRLNILSPDVQSVGIGVVHGRKTLHATQLFVGRRDVGPDAAARQAEALREAIETLPRPTGLGAADEDPALTRIAQSVAAGLAAGQVASGDASKTAFGALRKAGLGYTMASVQAGATHRPARIADAKEVADPRVQFYGVGVAGGRFSERNTFFVVVIYAGR